MNALTHGSTALLDDVQARPDDRNLPIDAVGVAGVRYPVTIAAIGRIVPTVATFEMTVELPAHVKGTHMSRFIEVLEASTEPLDPEGFIALTHTVRERLQAPVATVVMRFAYFVRKAAPVTGVSSLLDCEATWRCDARAGGASDFGITVVTPVTSLCPCSKEISENGAHNQRSHVRIETRLSAPMRVEELVAIAERAASCEVYGLLKRPDEKYVTEKAYENPKFVEDLVRDVAVALSREPRVRGYAVEVENFESIHNHSAIARMRGGSMRRR